MSSRLLALALSVCAVSVVAAEPETSSYKRCGDPGLSCVDVAQPLDSIPSSSRLGLVKAAGVPGTIDAAVLESIIRQRVSSVTQQMLRDVLLSAAKDRQLPELVEDLVSVLAALPVSAADKETLSQVLTAATVRANLVVTIGIAASDATCLDSLSRFDAAYEGLAASKVAHALGFTFAQGRVRAECKPLAEKITEWADTIGLEDKDTRAITPGSGVLGAVKGVLYALANRGKIARGDMVTLVTAATNGLDEAWPKKDGEAVHADAKKIVDAFLNAVPVAIREDETAPGGLKLDGVALASQIVSDYVDDHREGFYLRASIGTGVLTIISSDKSPLTGPSLHEELGVGYRWRPGSSTIAKSLLIGPHIGVSGLLYKLSLNGEATNNLFVFAGASLNLYRLIDVSLSLGLLHNTNTNIDRFGAVLSLQIPLSDYVKEAVTAASTESQ